MPKPFVPSEDHESFDLARWLDVQIAFGAPLKFTHIPNETPTNKIQAMRLKRMGVRAGCPDYLLVIRNRVHFIELKKRSNGKVSQVQQSWLDALNMAGVGAHVCHGFTEARELVSNLLAGKL